MADGGWRKVLCLLVLAAPLFALDVPPKPTAWVTDNAGILSPSEEQALNQKLEALKQRNGAEFLIMTFPSLEGEDVTDYTNRVADQWKIKGDRALMLFVFPNDRKMWIQVGYGLEGEIPDAIASRVYRETLVPRFRANAYYQGINEAVDQLIQRIDPNAVPATSTTTAPLGRPAGEQPKASGIDVGFIIFLAIVFLFFILPMLTRRNRRGGCGGCIFPFFFGGGGPGITFGGGGSSGGGGFNIGGSWGGGGSSFGGGGAGGGW